MRQGKEGVTSRMGAVDLLEDVVQDIEAIGEICSALGEWHHDPLSALNLLPNLTDMEAGRIRVAKERIYQNK